MKNKLPIMDIVTSETTEEALRMIESLSKEQVLETSEGGHNILHVLAADPKVHSSNLDIVSVVQAIVAKNPEVLNARLEILFTNPITNEAESLEGETPLHSAAQDGQKEVAVEILEAAKGNPELLKTLFAPDNHGWSPLLWAVCKGHKKVAVAILKAAKGNPEFLNTLFAPDNHGWSPLHLSVRLGYEDIIKELLANGACPSLSTLLGSNLSAKMNAMLGSAFIKNHASSAYSAGWDILEGAAKAYSGDVTELYDKQAKQKPKRASQEQNQNNNQR